MRRQLTAILLAGLFSTAALALDDNITVQLEAQNDSGQTGSATLIPEGGQTRVVVLLSNAPAGVAQPAHIHLGRCDTLDPAPKWKLESLQDGKSTTMVPVSLDTILDSKAAINIHKSAQEVQVYVSCGNIIPLM